MAGPLLRTLLRTLPQNLARTFSEPFLERCVAKGPLRRVLGAFFHDGPMAFAICAVSPYCTANVAQLWSSLSKTSVVTFLWRYGVCLSPEGHQAVTDPRMTPTPFPPIKEVYQAQWVQIAV